MDPAAVAGIVVGVIAVLVLIALVAFLRADRKKDPTSAGRSRTVSHAEIRTTSQRLMTSADNVASPPDRALDNVTYESDSEAGPGVPDIACENAAAQAFHKDTDSVAPPDRALDKRCTQWEPGVPDMACEVPPVVSVAGDESPVYVPPPAASRQVSDI